MIQEVYKTAIYCRLSSDDGNVGDSSSIQTQKLMLEKYCNEHNFKVVDTYVDDGFSGLNYNRPSFQRLLKDIEDKRINVVITKDLSRLGRDYIQTGYYTEIYFQSKGVRYIAVNDNVDTNRDDNDIAPFKNILNDMYAKDLSKKVKSAKRQRALNGMFISAQTPFGYKKNPNNPNQLTIDEEPAETVKEIFRLALEGKGIVAIQKILTERKILTPAAYKAKQGDTRFERYYSLRGEDWEYNWCPATVRTIMRDIVYVGDMENRKYEIENYKTKKRVPVPQEKHIIVKDTHEAIISRTDFETVQELVSAKRRTRKHTDENIFKSIIFCKTCGHRMHFANVTRNRAKGTKVYELLYKCSHHFTNPTECTKNNGINYFNLKEIITNRIRYLFSLLKDDQKLIQMYYDKTAQDNSIEKYKLEKFKIEKRNHSLVKLTSKVYNDNVEGLIDDNTCSELLKNYQDEQKSLNQKLIEINKYLEKDNDFVSNLNKLKQVVKDYLDFKELTIEMVNMLISKIVIAPKELVDGQRMQEISIVYRFINISI